MLAQASCCESGLTVLICTSRGIHTIGAIDFIISNHYIDSNLTQMTVHSHRVVRQLLRQIRDQVDILRSMYVKCMGELNFN